MLNLSYGRCTAKQNSYVHTRRRIRAQVVLDYCPFPIRGPMHHIWTSGSSLRIVNRKGRFTLFNLAARFLRNGIVKLKIGSIFFNLTCCTYEQIFYFGSTLHFRYCGISGCLCNGMKEAGLNFQTMSCPSFLSAMIKRETK